MAASINESTHTHTHMTDVDLEEDAIRRQRQLDLDERYHHLPVYRLEKESELREVNLPQHAAGTPTAQHRHVHTTNDPHRHTTTSEDREYPVDVPSHTHTTTAVKGQPATLTVHEQQTIHQTPGEQHRETKTKTKTKTSKHVGFGGFGGFGRKGQTAHETGAEGDIHQTHVDNGYEKNGAHTNTRRGFFGGGGAGGGLDGQGHPVDYEKPTILTIYPYWLKRVPGILRIVQLLVGIIVCAAVNAERCLSSSITTIVCASASSPLWYGVLGGQGFVLFVAIVFILGNFALIFYHICTRPRDRTTVVTTSTSTTTGAGGTTAASSITADKARLAELGYDCLAVILYIIAASVEAWYASWLTLPVNWTSLTAVTTQYVRNVYRPQWIAAAVFAWINVALYVISILLNFMSSRRR